jgi:hypothetical protein
VVHGFPASPQYPLSAVVHLHAMQFDAMQYVPASGTPMRALLATTVLVVRTRLNGHHLVLALSSVMCDP